MRRKGQRSVGKNLTFNDRSSCLVGPALQPLTSDDETLGVVRLFSNTGTAVRDTYSEWCHITVEPGQLG